ncbi:MAG: aminotransferase class V-fold PLP-dependent enzyme [Elusimicrobiaceae bacterium]|nr:aminotransferase class V-fold PLP-dependent enzyme [Elusimicrobiaceae bacterium]
MKLNLTENDLPTSTFACGPGQGHAQIRQTPLYQTLFERSHRAPDVTTHGMYAAAEKELRTLLAIPSDYLLCFFPGGATTALDAVTWSLSVDSVSGLSFGAFSKRWCEQITTQIPGLKKDIKIPPAGTFFPWEPLDTNASLILLTPNETSTGVQIPDHYLLDIWQHKGPHTLVAWDCTSCAGGRVLPQAYDIMAFGLQKCFGTGGGTAVLILSPRAVERISEVKKIRQIPYSLDLSYAVTHAQKAQTINTPSTMNIWMCYQAARWMNAHGGLATMENLCRAHAQYLFDWAAQTDWVRPRILDEKLRSFTTPTFQITDPQISADAINQALAETGLANLQDGIKKFTTAPANSLRIACFPFVDPNGTEQYAKLTRLLDEIVRQLRK